MKRVVVLADEKSEKVVNGSGLVRSLAKIDGLPLIVRNLRILHAAGVEEAIVVTGFEAEQVRDVLSRYHIGLRVVEVENRRHLERLSQSIRAIPGVLDVGRRSGPGTRTDKAAG